MKKPKLYRTRTTIMIPALILSRLPQIYQQTVSNRFLFMSPGSIRSSPTISNRLKTVTAATRKAAMPPKHIFAKDCRTLYKWFFFKAYCFTQPNQKNAIKSHRSRHKGMFCRQSQILQTVATPNLKNSTFPPIRDQKECSPHIHTHKAKLTRSLKFSKQN